MRFCIDKHEFTEQGETLPANHRSWRDGDRTCKKLGKRMCMEANTTSPAKVRTCSRIRTASPGMRRPAMPTGTTS